MSKTHKKKIVIVGAGPGGLTAGMLLAHNGHDVEIYEKSSTPGGRNSSLHLGEYRFDVGPTFFMMDFVIRDIFKSVDRNFDDYVKAVKLSPMYRLHFHDRIVDTYEEDEKMIASLSQSFPGADMGLRDFNKREEKRFRRLYPILSKDNNSLIDALNIRFIRALGSFSIGKSIFDVLGKYFKDERARLCFTFQSKYLGMSPWECPGAFAMVPFVEQQFGIFHIQGGLSEVPKAMAKIFLEKGGKIFYDSPVQNIITVQNQAKGIVLKDNKKIYADKVIVNADFAYSTKELMKDASLKKYSERNIDEKDFSCSILLMYIGSKKVFDMPHHSISFAKNYKKNVDDVFAGRLTDKDFSIYVCNASKTDPSASPQGKSALYVLVPVPNNRSGIDWNKYKQIVREQTLDIMEQRLGMIGIRESIEIEKIITPTDWEKDYNVYKGAVFNLSHKLSQMLWFRPHNKFEEIDNVFLVGGGTHPGSGLPTIFQSGKIVADLISSERD